MKKLTIIQLNDSHAYLEPHQEMFWEGGKKVYRKTGGFARMALAKNLKPDDKLNAVGGLIWIKPSILIYPPLPLRGGAGVGSP
ncbi:hypothetical protein MKJ04_05815 [Pontibacter sp. E15-1]|uniref:hypothetical protein n=1 Tax=Pontibacter sp. E15-1 TaxID=2919918 RepID=UPI001F50423D|nr:hypothetical protein [Pontibacter sp. E15-1]MCJ8164353.1 hypothetical protein [Pontibacter sp. E15-1]